MKKGNRQLNLNALENRARRRRANRDQITVVNTPVAKSIAKESQDMDSPRFKVLEVTFPGRAPIQISGGAALIPLQLSLLNALLPFFDEKGDMSEKEFLDWAALFEGGFLHLKNPKGPLTEWQKKLTPWGKPFNNRPKIWIFSEKKSPHICQLFPDRTNEKDFFLFSGNYRDIINQIMGFWNLKDRGGGNNEINRTSKPGKSVVGYILIVLQFQEITEKNALFFEKSFRLVGKSDKPSDKEDSMISEGYLKMIASRVIAQFPPDYKWDRGKMCVSYKGEIPRQQGLDGWAYCRAQQDGIDLFKRLAACIGVEIDTRFIRISEALNPDASFPQIEEEYQLLGKRHRKPILRKNCSVRLYSATAILPFSDQKIPLVRGNIALI